MPGWVGVVHAISDDVVAKLAAGGYTPLVDGKIVIGRQRLNEEASPPRIVFVPMGSKFTPKEVYGRSNVQGSPSDELRLMWQLRSIKTEVVHFEVHVWGAASPPDVDDDYDAAQALYQQVIASTHLLAVGSYDLSTGSWVSGSAQASQLIRFGQEFVFGLDIFTPVLDQLLPYAPPDVAMQATTSMDPNDGTAVVTGCADP